MLNDRQNGIGNHAFEDITSIENILVAWQEFVRGKRRKKDVQEFSRDLMGNIIYLHTDLIEGRYKHEGYKAFKISDPKPRDIHKATVQDRLIHHAIYRKLYPIFDRTWIADSFSCRDGKGTHRAIDRFRIFAGKVSQNNTRTAWILKCDVKKFFASIDHSILLGVVSKKIKDKRTINLIENIVHSFSSTGTGKGLPLGNLTSQMLVNVYMNEFDQFMKHKIKAKYYIRYADDFVVMSADRSALVALVPVIAEFLLTQLKLSLHPDKVFIKTLASGVDFLGWIHFVDHRILRTASKKRMSRNLGARRSPATEQSYRGMLSHGNAHKLSGEMDLQKL